jgi:hypothetical protein
MRYHLTTRKQIDHYGDATVRSGTILADGNYRAVVDFDDDADPEYLEKTMEEDENIISYDRDEPTLREHLRRAGSAKSPAKAKSARANGALGGRPRVM